MPERWPALMLKETAAEYCDMSPQQFDRQCPVAPVDQGWRGHRWKKAKLDDWIAALPEKRLGKSGALDAPEPANTDEPPLSAEERRRASLAKA